MGGRKAGSFAEFLESPFPAEIRVDQGGGFGDPLVEGGLRRVGDEKEQEPKSVVLYAVFDFVFRIPGQRKIGDGRETGGSARLNGIAFEFKLVSRDRLAACIQNFETRDEKRERIERVLIGFDSILRRE